MTNKPVLIGAAALTAGVLLAGPQVAQSAVNYFDATRVVTGSGTAYCPSGFKVTGGGFKTLPRDYYGTYSSDEYAITGSFALSTTAWTVTGTRVHGTYSSSRGWTFSTYSYTPGVTAVCVN